MNLKDAKVMITMPAVDLERAKKFYMEKLGFSEPEMKIKDHLSFTASSGTELVLYKRGQTKADHTVASFQVEDVEETVKALSEKGVVFEQYDFPGLKTDERGIAILDGEKAAWFKDSEGNILSVGTV